MMKKLVILFACLGLGLQLSSCTSKDSHAESEVAADVDSADLEKLEGESAAEVAAAENGMSGQLPEESLGETAPKAVEPEAPAADVAATTPEALPPDPFAESTPAATTSEPAASSSITEVPTPSQPVTVVESTPKEEASTTTIVEPEPAPAKPVSAPLQKMAAAPWQVGKVWYNTVYFARPGDTLKSISQMIYGADKSKELKKGNVTFKSRGVKPGDKVYYNSPNRPDDSSRMLTFYEDSGIASEVYVAKAGDNIKKISKKLLGYEGAWKEVWASNTVDSKGALTEGTELRYWKGGAPSKTEVAAANPPASTPMEHPPESHPSDMPPMPPAEEIAAPAQVQNPPPPPPGEMPPPPPMPEQQAGMEMPPPPPAGGMEQPPPPPPVQAVNPPPPPPKHAEEMAAAEGGEEEGNTDMTTALAGVIIIAAGAAGLIVLRKRKKQKELDQQAAMENTHVGT